MPSEPSASFPEWLDNYRELEFPAGIEPEVRRILDSVDFNQEVWQKASFQPEHTLSLEQYLTILAGDSQECAGRQKLRLEDKNLDLIKQSGLMIDPCVLVAIWGVETRYGVVRGDYGVIEALATLACGDETRRAFFQNNLTAAIEILQSGVVESDRFLGSWAGATGHTQFMPLTYQKWSIDITRRGGADIWSDDPLDALASSANYLKHLGWRQGKKILAEVMLSDNFNYMAANSRIREPASSWLAKGVEFLGSRTDETEACSIMIPVGKDGPAFAIFDNFEVVLGYNRSRMYAIAVGQLYNQLSGGTKIESGWPPSDQLLTRQEVKTLQSRLVQLGYDTGGTDGLAGPKTVQSIQRYQSSYGMVPDGFPTRELLDFLES